MKTATKKFKALAAMVESGVVPPDILTGWCVGMEDVSGIWPRYLFVGRVEGVCHHGKRGVSCEAVITLALNQENGAVVRMHRENCSSFCFTIEEYESRGSRIVARRYCENILEAYTEKEYTALLALVDKERSAA